MLGTTVQPELECNFELLCDPYVDAEVELNTAFLNVIGQTMANESRTAVVQIGSASWAEPGVDHDKLTTRKF